MPITFKRDKKQEPNIIDKDGTKFYFKINEAVRKRVRLNMVLMGERDFGAMIMELFRVSLIGWENLYDENKAIIEFSIPVRDSIVCESDIFNDDDVLNIFNLGAPDSKKSKEKDGGEKDDSTLKKHSRKPSSTAGDLKDA